jgi:hypothetical protein
MNTQPIGEAADLNALVPVGRFCVNKNCKACAGALGPHTCCFKCRNFAEADKQPALSKE